MKATKIILTSFIFAIFLFSFVLSVPAASAAVSHSASQITSGTFPAGNFVFQNNLDVNGNLFANSVLVNSWLYNQTTPANSYTNAVVSANTAAWSSTYNATYAAYSAYSYNQTAPAINYTDSVVSANNASWLSTYNLTYNAKNSSQWIASGNDIYNRNSGNVGIGTSSPGARLAVNDNGVFGTAKFTSSSGYGTDIVMENTGGGTTYRLQSTGSTSGWGSGKFVIQDSSNARFVIDSSGNVGIGTTSPMERLHVRKDGADAIILKLNDGTADSKAYIRLGNDADNWDIGIDGGVSDSFFIGDPETGTKLTILQTSGNVGIGTTNPGAKLVSNGMIRVISEGSSAGPAGAEITYSAAKARFGGYNRDSSAYVPWYAYGSQYEFDVSGSVKMVLDSSGKVGIGTASPGATLDLASTSTGDRLTIRKLNDNTKYFTFQMGGDDMGLNYQASGAAEFLFKTDGTFIANNVGIGTTSPAAKLDVFGPTLLRAANGNAHSWFPAADGNVYVSADYDSGGQIIFRKHRADGTEQRYVTISSAGNVGIGISGHGSKLAVAGDLNLRGDGSAIRHEATDGTLKFLTGLRSDVSPGNFVFYSYGGNWVFPGGNVGIGTTTPGAKLDVAGNIAFTGQKFCSAMNPGGAVDTIVVPPGWTTDTCNNWRIMHGYSSYFIGCIFTNSYSRGSDGGGAPSPNCGW